MFRFVLVGERQLGEGESSRVWKDYSKMTKKHDRLNCLSGRLLLLSGSCGFKYLPVSCLSVHNAAISSNSLIR